jgi:transposase
LPAPTKISRREVESLDLTRLRDLLEELMAGDRRQPLLDVVLGLLTKCKDVIEEQAFEIAALEKQLFGRKSEKCSDAQLSLFTQILSAVAARAEPSTLESPGSSTLVPSPAKGGTKPDGSPKKRKQPRPTISQVIPVPDEERPCPICGGERHCIGHARSLVIEYTPPKLDVIENLREKLACRRCDGEISTAPTPDGKLERSRPGPRLLATLAINKVVDGLPLHRTRRAFGRLGVHIPVQTLNRWEDRGYELAEPVANRIASLVQCADLINLDDTSLRVRDPTIRGETRHGHIWVFAARKFDPGGDLRKTAVFIYYLYAPTWEAKYPQKFLLNSTAILQGDAYAGYGSVAVPLRAGAPKNILVGCMMHARRGFFEAMQAGDPAAFFFIERFQRIYEIEAEAKTTQLTALARLELRRQRSLPLLHEMRSRLEDIRGTPAIKPMRDATRYLRNQWSKLLYPFEQDGRLEIDNGEAERRLRRVASGRKAWLFAGSERGAARFAGMLSLVATAEANDVEPGGYLADILGKLSGDWPNRRLDDLLPHRWKLLQESA